jgi:PilZ domain
MKHHLTILPQNRNQNSMERRKFTRFRVQDNAYAALREEFSKVGKIYDISLNGLAFRYLAEKISDETFTHVDIFLTNNGFHLAVVPCRIIYNVKESTFGLNGLSLYRCGLKFEQNNEQQKNKIVFFINNHTTGILLSKTHEDMTMH